MPAIAELLCPTWTEGRHASRTPAARVAHRHSCSIKACTHNLPRSVTAGRAPHLRIHTPPSDAASATRLGAVGQKHPTVPGFEQGRACPPHQNLNFDRSLSRTEIIGRFILTTAMPTVNMETQLSLIMPYNSAALRNLNYEAEIRQKKRTPSSLQHTVP